MRHTCLGLGTVLLHAGALALSLLLPSAALAGLPRVMSTDLCSDLLLLRIAAPEQVLSVSAASQDPRLSPLANQARAYPSNRGGVEDLLYRHPDQALVYLGWSGRRHADLLAGQGTEVISLPYPKGWSDALTTTRQIAARIGRATAGEALAAEAERRMAALAARLRPYRLLYLRPNGGSAGQGTYVDDLLTHLGLRNLAAEQGRSGWGRFPLEPLAVSPPDLFLLGYFDPTRAPRHSAYGRHPLLRSLLERTPAVSLPSNAWGCGGLELVEAAERLVAEIARLEAVGRLSAPGSP